MKTYHFKSDFEKKLRTLKVKSRFLKYLRKKAKDSGIELTLVCEDLDNKPTWYLFIMSAFDFSTTEEGVKFWIDIACSQVEGKDPKWS